MHYDIHYSADKSEDLKALNDLRDYLGQEALSKLWGTLARSDLSTYSQRKHLIQSARFAMEMFAGVSGRPVTALIRATFRNYKETH